MGDVVQENVRPRPEDQRDDDAKRRADWPLAKRPERLPERGGQDSNDRSADKVKTEQYQQARRQAESERAREKAMREPIHVQVAKSVTEIRTEAADHQRREIEILRAIAPQR